MTKITLIGFMGSGKSSVAVMLSDMLSLSLVECDDEVEKLAASTIAELIDTKGEAAFRDLERQVCAALADKEHVVISPGGGAILNQENVAAFKANSGLIVFLDTSFDVILDRIKDRESRPFLRDLDAARDRYDTRLPLYRSAADYEINTDSLSIDAVARKVAKLAQT